MAEDQTELTHLRQEHPHIYLSLSSLVDSCRADLVGSAGWTTSASCLFCEQNYVSSRPASACTKLKYHILAKHAVELYERARGKEDLLAAGAGNSIPEDVDMMDCQELATSAEDAATAQGEQTVGAFAHTSGVPEPDIYANGASPNSSQAPTVRVERMSFWDTVLTGD
jgi:hypothetical protein